MYSLLRSHRRPGTTSFELIKGSTEHSLLRCVVVQSLRYRPLPLLLLLVLPDKHIEFTEY
jgi:hypothetical protein